jgi:hypothetical protein
MRAEWPAYLMHRDLIVPTIECLVNSQTVKLLSVHRSPFSWHFLCLGPDTHLGAPFSNTLCL